MKEKWLAEAKRIGDLLLKDSLEDEFGVYWETMEMDPDYNITFGKSDGIYSGVSGICLFLIELYRQTREKKYLDAAVKGMDWTVHSCRETAQANSAFITGRIGVAYVLLQMNDYRNEAGRNDYLNLAGEIARSVYERLKDAKDMIDDFINGTSGIVLASMHLYNSLREDWLLELIDSLVRNLINRANFGPKGLYWDRSEQHISGLCGFSHGAAGVGYTFLELAHYFKNDTFKKIADLAFEYERHFYKPEITNWPDLRCNLYTENERKKYEDAYEKGEMELFTKGGDMNAWCHGAAGIGLSRFRALQLYPEKIYEEEALIAIKRTEMSDSHYNEKEMQTSPTFTICHGGGGNADIFLHAYTVLGDEHYLKLAENVAEHALKFYQKDKKYYPGFRLGAEQEDRSLFMGNAGIGYFFLRLLDPKHTRSILLPILDAEIENRNTLLAYSHLTLDSAKATEMLLEKDFKRTIFVARQLSPDKLTPFFESGILDKFNEVHIPHAFMGLIETIIPQLDENKREILSDIFQLESEKFRMDEAIKSHAYLYVKEIVQEKKASELLDKLGNFNTQVFKISPDHRLWMASLNWSLQNSDLWESNLKKSSDNPEEMEEGLLLLKSSAYGVIEIELNPFSYTILFEFQEPSSVERVIRNTLDSFEALSSDDEKMLMGKITEQIRLFLSSGIIIK